VGEYSGEDDFAARGEGALYRMTLASRASSLLWGGDSFLMGCKVEGANFWGVPPKNLFHSLNNPCIPTLFVYYVNSSRVQKNSFFHVHKITKTY
jgi:hypothetical protein